MIVVEGTGRQDKAAADPEEAVSLAAGYVRGGARKREAARRAAEQTGVPAGRIYQALVEQAGVSPP